MARKTNVQRVYRPLSLFEEEAEQSRLTFGRTDVHSSGDEIINEYLGGTSKGAYGREKGYEIVLIFGDTGQNKSTFATQLILEPAKAGKRVVYYSLEDDPKDLHTRIVIQTQDSSVSKFQDDRVITHQITPNLLIPAESVGYTLDDMATEISRNFLEMDADIVVIDPLQFIFESSVVERAETEFNRQRLFLRQINHILKKAAEQSGKDKTIIIVSHTNKGRYDNAIDNIMGSGALKQVPTKIVQVGTDDKQGIKFIRLWKSRFTPFRHSYLQVKLNTARMRLEYTLPPDAASNLKWKEELRRTWERKTEN